MLSTRHYASIAIIVTILISRMSFSTTINVGVSNFQFTPANINATVGDTIKWNWVSGGHTTTCNGTNGSTRPGGASPWDADLNNGSPTFRYVITVAGSYHYVCTPHAPDMAGNITAVASAITQLSSLVSNYELSQNFPNPFNPVTKINFSIPKSTNVVLKVYNELGKEVETLVNENLAGGNYEVQFNGANFGSGIYYYRIEASGFVQTRKMLLIK